MTGQTVPLRPQGMPSLEDLRVLQQSPLEALVMATRRYGDLIHYNFGPFPVYVLNHPAYIKHVLQDNHRNYTKDTFQYNLLKAVTGRGLLTSDGAFWLQQRRLAQPAFHRERIASLSGLMVARTEEMLQRWEPAARRGEPLDVAAEMMHLTPDIVSRALFGVDLSGEAAALAEDVLVVLDHLVYRARTLGLIPSFLPTGRNRRFRGALRNLDRVVYRLIEERRQRNSPAQDLLALLMAAQDDEEPAGRPARVEQSTSVSELRHGMSDRQLRDEVMTLLIAGHETVASALTWTWYLLAGYPEVEQRLRAEVSGAPAPGENPGASFSRQVFEEALRLYPPAWMITRRSIGEDEIAGYRLPPRSLVVLSPFVTHRHPEFWQEPEQFDPCRFAPERATERPQFAYFPFGGGPRLCIGNHFALMEAQAIMTTIVRRYRLELLPDQTIEIEAAVTLRPRHGLMMVPHPY